MTLNFVPTLPEGAEPMGRSYIVGAADAGIARVAARAAARVGGQVNHATARVLYVERIAFKLYEVVLQDGWVEAVS